LIAIAFLALVDVNLWSIFFIAFVPGLLATLMMLFVRETPTAAAAKAKLDLSVRQFPRSYWTYLLVTALVGIGNSSTSFLILRTTDLGASLTTTIFLYALVNLAAAFVSYPAGYLSDSFGRKGMLLLSFLAFFAVYLGFGITTNVVLVGFLFVLYGLYQGIFRSVGKALASDLVSSELQASGVGWYTATIGITGLVASIVGGELWTRVSPSATFFFGPDRPSSEVPRSSCSTRGFKGVVGSMPLAHRTTSRCSLHTTLAATSEGVGSVRPQAGSNSSIGLPEGSSRRTCLPPLPIEALASGGELLVTGQTAFDLDFSAVVAQNAPLAIGLVVLATYAALFLLLGSVLLPLKAVVMNLLSITASYGALV
jgi:MFS family permease